MRENDLQPPGRRRYVATTASAHDLPIFPDLAKALRPGSDQLRVGDLTYVAISGGFAYLALILYAWSRRAVGYAIGRSRGTPIRSPCAVPSELRLGAADALGCFSNWSRAGCGRVTIAVPA